MDRRVKERLIGASILVVLIVLVVPEMLSGPKPAPPTQPMLPAAPTSEPNRTVTVDLSTSKSAADPAAEPLGQPASAATPTPEAGPTNATNATNAANAVAPTGAPTMPAGASARVSASTQGAAPPRAAVESAAPPPISLGRGSWSVQLGSFASRANADNLTRQMKGQGFAAFVLEGGSGSSVRYRVRVGPLPDRESAERMAAKLKTLKHDSSLVAPAG